MISHTQVKQILQLVNGFARAHHHSKVKLMPTLRKSNEVIVLAKRSWEGETHGKLLEFLLGSSGWFLLLEEWDTQSRGVSISNFCLSWVWGYYPIILGVPLYAEWGGWILLSIAFLSKKSIWLSLWDGDPSEDDFILRTSLNSFFVPFLVLLQICSFSYLVQWIDVGLLKQEQQQKKPYKPIMARVVQNNSHSDNRCIIQAMK